jgi:hypothetical protein
MRRWGPIKNLKQNNRTNMGLVSLREDSPKITQFNLSGSPNTSQNIYIESIHCFVSHTTPSVSMVKVKL